MTVDSLCFGFNRDNKNCIQCFYSINSRAWEGQSVYVISRNLCPSCLTCVKVFLHHCQPLPRITEVNVAISPLIEEVSGMAIASLTLIRCGITNVDDQGFVVALLSDTVSLCSSSIQFSPSGPTRTIKKQIL